jgi:acetyl-CoA carboxylase biotin carboxyl carrier protein
MDLKLIKSLISMISDSDVNEVTIEEGEFKIKIKKQPEIQAAREQVYYAPQPQVAPAPQVAPVAQTSAPASTPAQAEAPKASGLTIKSPIVGTFYSKPSPDASPFIKVGDTVKKGQVLCIIEAMKIMNEIESEHDGKITQILAQDAQPVEFDQPLFTIENV